MLEPQISLITALASRGATAPAESGVCARDGSSKGRGTQGLCEHHQRENYPHTHLGGLFGWVFVLIYLLAKLTFVPTSVVRFCLRGADG